MNRAELVNVVAEQANGLTKKAVVEVVDLVFDTIAQSLSTGEKVVISGFGTFEVRQRVARTGRNPRTGSDIAVPAQKTPAFKTGKGLKELVR